MVLELAAAHVVLDIVPLMLPAARSARLACLALRAAHAVRDLGLRETIAVLARAFRAAYFVRNLGLREQPLAVLHRGMLRDIDAAHAVRDLGLLVVPAARVALLQELLDHYAARASRHLVLFDLLVLVFAGIVGDFAAIAEFVQRSCPSCARTPCPRSAAATTFVDF